MMTLQASELLNVWECALLESSPMRALLMASAADTGQSMEQLLHASIGQRDAILLELYENLFGPEIAGLARCDACAAALELNVDTRALRVDFDRRGGPHELRLADYATTFRSVNSADLLSLAATSACDDVKRTLLARCVLDARRGDTTIEASCLPAHVVAAVSERMAELDAQSEVVFNVECAVCAVKQRVTFDIAEHLWAQLDRWARSLLGEVHRLAAAYGWSESSLLDMSAARRRAYLVLLGAAN